MRLRSVASVGKRRDLVESTLGVTLSQIGESSYENTAAPLKNCENMVGTAKIPLGIAGPLLVISGTKSRDVYMPLATTEGALVASISRGCKATTKAGIRTHAQRVGANRSPVFFTGSLAKSLELVSWVKSHHAMLSQIAIATSSHLSLLEATTMMLADYVYLLCYYDTKDAMGMNMATIATEQIARHIEKQTGATLTAVSGNVESDKKPSWMNIIHGRGFQVWAEAVIDTSTVQSVLKTTPEAIVEVWKGKSMLGSAMSGSLGFNAHFANIVAAIFIATGQDPAHVVEGSLGITTARVTETGDLYFSIYMPSLLLGTVGGGTGLPTQKEALSLMQTYGEGKVMDFAESVGSAVLAGELSLLASLSEGTLGKAHETLGRGKK